MTRAFEYDALYRLISGNGRESGVYANSSSPWTEAHVPSGGSGNADTDTRAYTRTYAYDLLGNLLRLHHDAGSANTFNRDLNGYVPVTNENPFGASGNTCGSIKYGATTISYGFDACGNPRYCSGGWTSEWRAVRTNL